MMLPSDIQVLVATQPVDFRKQMDGLAALVAQTHSADPYCELHRIGEDTTKRLDKVPAKVRVIVEVRPKYACRTCEKTGTDNVAGIVQAPAPAHLIEGGLPTEALVADVVVSKHADHLPLYRQSQILARHGVRIDRSTLAGWVGAAAAELQPLHDHLLAVLKASPKLFCDETRCPVLDPGRGKTKTGYLWAIARDDRPWAGTGGGAEHSGSGPPAVAYVYAPGRGGQHALKLLDGFSGVLQVKPAHVRYIKLGSGGAYARTSLGRGESHLGYHEVPHDLCADGDWDAGLDHFVKRGRKLGKAKDATREVRDFYSLGSDALWITFADDRRMAQV